MFTDLINANELIQLYQQDHCQVIDCRYNLIDPEAGYRDYLEAHIPGAVFADTHSQLSGPPVTDHGRHPLPTPTRLEEVFGELGVNNGTQVIAYDDSFGAFAARLWWLLRYMGHEAVAVLDGGWSAWLENGGESDKGLFQPEEGDFNGVPSRDRLVLLEEVENASMLVDSREAPRYLGEEEPIDPHAGHIPGAINRCWKDNITKTGYFHSPRHLQRELTALFGEEKPENVVFYCGSGVTACHNLLAVKRAGLPAGKLYAGSWSEWCSDDSRARATGIEK